MMFWMIVVPELVLAWAVRQYFVAKEIRDTVKASVSNCCYDSKVFNGTDFNQEFRPGANGRWHTAT